VKKLINRRQFLAAAALAPVAVHYVYALSEDKMTDLETKPARFFFLSQGKTAMMNADGSGLRYFEFDVPDQATWQACGFFADGRVLFLSMEPRRDGPGRPFDEYYHQTPTHLWVYDLDMQPDYTVTGSNERAYQLKALAEANERIWKARD